MAKKTVKSTELNEDSKTQNLESKTENTKETIAKVAKTTKTTKAKKSETSETTEKPKKETKPKTIKAVKEDKTSEININSESKSIAKSQPKTTTSKSKKQIVEESTTSTEENNSTKITAKVKSTAKSKTEKVSDKAEVKTTPKKVEQKKVESKSVESKSIESKNQKDNSQNKLELDTNISDNKVSENTNIENRNTENKNTDNRSIANQPNQPNQPRNNFNNQPRNNGDRRNDNRVDSRENRNDNRFDNRVDNRNRDINSRDNRNNNRFNNNPQSRDNRNDNRVDNRNRDTRDNRDNRNQPPRRISNESPNYTPNPDRYTTTRITNNTKPNTGGLTKYENKRPNIAPRPNRFKPNQLNQQNKKPLQDLNSPITSLDTNDLKRLQEIEFKNKMRQEEGNKNPNHLKKNASSDKKEINLEGKNIDSRNNFKEKSHKDSNNKDSNNKDYNRKDNTQKENKLNSENIDNFEINDIELLVSEDVLDSSELATPEVLDSEVLVKINDIDANNDNGISEDIFEGNQLQSNTSVELITNEENQVIVDLSDDLINIQKTIREVKKKTYNDKNKNKIEREIDQQDKDELEIENTTEEIINPIEEEVNENAKTIELTSSNAAIDEKVEVITENKTVTKPHTNKHNPKLIDKNIDKNNEQQIENKTENKDEVNDEDKNEVKTNNNSNGASNNQLDKKNNQNSNNQNSNNQNQNQNRKEQFQKDLQRNLEKAIPKKEHLPKPKPIKVTEKKLTDAELKDPFYKKIIDSTYRFLRHRLNVEEGTTILLAVSGGVDSVVMLDILYNLTSRYRIGLDIAHYNHNLRGQASIEDEKFVRGLAEFYGLQYHFTNGNVKDNAEKHNLSIETAARNLRYKFFEKVVAAIKCSYVATAHNANDLAETFLLNLTRGSGLTGLSGIPIKRPLNKSCSVIRPIIELKKEDIIEYAKRRNLEWREDHTNAEAQYTRNKIRHVVLPLLEQEFNPSIVDVINRTAKLIGGADRFLTRFVNDNSSKVTNVIDEHTIKLNIGLLKTYNHFIQGEIIQNVLISNFNLQNLNLNLIDRVIDLIRAEVNTKVELTKELKAYRDREEIIITDVVDTKTIDIMINRTVNAEYDLGEYIFSLKLVEPDEVDYDSENHIEYFDAQFMPQFLQLRNWKDGDSFKPIGMNGNSMKVSDLLTNEKVAANDKKSILVLTDKVNIIWVVGYRLSEDYKVKPNSKSILKVEITPKTKEVKSIS